MNSQHRPLATSRQDEYRILPEGELRDYLAGLPAIAARLGGAPAAWSISEVGDGNLNLVFIVKGAEGRRRRQAGAALCAAGRRELAAAAVALALRASGAHASGAAGARAGAGRAAPRRGARPRRHGAARAAHHHAQGADRRHALSALRRGHRDLSGAHAVLHLRPRDAGCREEGGDRGVRRQPCAVQDHRGPDLHRSLPRGRAEPLDQPWLDATAAAFREDLDLTSRSRGSS